MRSVVLTLLYLIIYIPAFAQNAAAPQFNFINNDRGRDIGGMAINSATSFQVQFKNSGDSPLVITDMHLSPNDAGGPPRNIQIKWPPKPVRPGKKGIITVTIKAGGEIGSFKNEILVTSNATTANYPLLYLTGAIVPEVRERTKSKDDEPVIPIEFLVPVIGAIK